MAAITGSLSGCAVVRSDADGNVRVFRLADVQVTWAERKSGLIGNVFTMRTLGLTLNRIDLVARLTLS